MLAKVMTFSAATHGAAMSRAYPCADQTLELLEACHCSKLFG